MPVADLLNKKVDIAGREVPVGVLLLGGGGAVVLFIVTRSAQQTSGQGMNPIDAAAALAQQAQQIQDQAGQAGQGGGAGGGADIGSTLASWSAGFGQQLTKAMDEQAKANAAALAQLQSQLSQYTAPSGGGAVAALPSIFPTPEVAAVSAMEQPKTPYVTAVAPQAPAAPIQKKTPQAPAPAPAPPPAPAPAPRIIPQPTTQQAQQNPELVQVRAYQQAQAANVVQKIVSTPAPSGYTFSSGGGRGSQMLGASPSTYTVKSGDVLSRIAKNYGVSLSTLAAANPQITNLNLIRPGQVINIPR